MHFITKKVGEVATCFAKTQRQLIADFTKTDLMYHLSAQCPEQNTKFKYPITQIERSKLYFLLLAKLKLSFRQQNSSIYFPALKTEVQKGINKLWYRSRKER